MLVPFIGYALRRRFIGYVDCAGERLTDFLNHTESVVIHEAYVENFEDETVVNLGDGEVARSLLYAVEGSGGGGEATRRVVSVGQRLQVQIGPYSALGLLHTGHGQMPLPYLTSHGPMIPLSDATLGFAPRGGAPALRDVGTLIINRDLLDWVRASDDEAAAFQGVRVVSDRA